MVAVGTGQTILNWRHSAGAVATPDGASMNREMDSTLLLSMTAGATVDEVAKSLKKGGAYRVYVVTVARG